MALFTFRCRDCGHSIELHGPIGKSPLPPVCRWCGAMTRRDYRTDKPQPAPVWQEHWNPSVGGYVSDRRKMQSMMDRASDDLFERSGIEQKNVVVERGDMPTENSHLG